jgi:hypothetical protein
VAHSPTEESSAALMKSLQSGLNALQPSSSLEAATRGSWGAFVPEALYRNEVPGVRRGIQSDVLRRLANEACDQVVVGHFPTQHLISEQPSHLRTIHSASLARESKRCRTIHPAPISWLDLGRTAAPEPAAIGALSPILRG